MKKTLVMLLKPLNKLCERVSIELGIGLTALRLATRRRLGRAAFMTRKKGGSEVDQSLMNHRGITLS